MGVTETAKSEPWVRGDYSRVQTQTLPGMSLGTWRKELGKRNSKTRSVGVV